MVNYILRRLGQGVISVLVLTIIMFFMSRLTGDPLNLILPVDAPPELRVQVSHQLGLDLPLWQQFVHYIGGLAHGDLGESIRQRIPVWQLYSEALPNTVKLILPAFVLAFVIGVPLGVVAATTKRRWLRRFLGGAGVIGMATPLFWLAVMLIFVFSVRLHWLPSSQAGGIDHYVLPVAALVLFLMAGLLRLVGSSMLDAIDSEYVKLARLKGESELRVVWKHALRNSLTGAVSYLGVMFAALITGSVVIEKVFAWPGTGRLIYDGIVARDYPVVQGVILCSATFIVLVTLSSDIVHAYLEPRIRL
jgi:ABC-type dipeptide/oligopeptide/nickel transport system permease component